MSLEKNKVAYVCVAVIVTALVVAGAMLLFMRPSDGSPAPARTSSTPQEQAVQPEPPDSGVLACRMMAEDKANNATPNVERSAREIELLLSSGNKDLRKAGALLKTGDVAQGFNALGLLISGCAELGSPI